jgi:hypothetical protein
MWKPSRHYSPFLTAVCCSVVAAVAAEGMVAVGGPVALGVN